MIQSELSRVAAKQSTRRLSVFLLFVALGLAACGDSPREPSLSFFVTSVGTGSIGGNFGGLAGADAICQNLAEAVGAGNRTWHAYLSTSSENARDRIGSGPWYNVRLQEVAPDVATLHENGIARLLWGLPADADEDAVLVDENGELVPLLEHDIVTGSTMEGTVSEGRTCLDWTSASDNEVAQVGHSDLTPPGIEIGGPDRFSWNSAHETVSCTQQGLAERYGSGRFYCFAID